MARGTFITLVLVCVCLVGCGSGLADEAGDSATVELTDQQRADAAVSQAIAQWADAVGWSPVVAGIRLEAPSDEADRTVGMWDEETATVILVPERLGDDPAHWAAVAMHELGHAYGAKHVADPAAVMYPQPGSTACVHEADAAEIRRALGTDAATTCER